MTLQFPSSPINGAVSGDYTYDAVKGAWRKNAALPVSVTHSDVAPSNPREGDQWWKSDEGTLFTYYNDGNSSQWVESTNVIANVEPNPIPAGAMMAWASNTIPTNWLLCDGSAVSRSTYASLFAAIGTQYGSGDGTTTFNLPNLRGRTIVGRDNSQEEFISLGQTGGAKTHTLTEAQMPSHTHIQNSHNHTQDSHNHTQNAHNHNFLYQGIEYAGWNAASVAGSSLNFYVGNSAIPQTTIANRTATNNPTTATNQPTTATNQNTGGGQAHNNLQPYIVLNYIIKFSAGETPGDSQLAVRVGAVEAANNATPLSQNYVINGAFDIWQRGTSATIDAANTYKTADRWVGYKNNAGATESRQSAGLVGFQYCARYQRNSGSSDTQPIWAYQSIETINSIPLAGKTVTLSFYARAGANYSASSFGLLVQLRSGTGTDQNALSGFSGSATPINQTATLTTTWQRFSYSASLLTNVTQLGVVFIGTPSGTAGANDWYEITGVQLEEGSYATPFRRNAPSIQAELAACQRYYQVIASGNLQYFATGQAYVGTAGLATYVFPVVLRAAPSALTVSSASHFGTFNASGGDLAATALSMLNPTTSSTRLDITVASGFSTGQAIILVSRNASAFLAVSAEL